MGWKEASLHPGSPSSPHAPSQTPPGLPFSRSFPESPPLSSRAHGPGLPEAPEACPPTTLVLNTHVRLPPASVSLPGLWGGRGEQRGLHEAAFSLCPEQGHLRLSPPAQTGRIRKPGGILKRAPRALLPLPQSSAQPPTSLCPPPNTPLFAGELLLSDTGRKQAKAWGSA